MIEERLVDHQWWLAPEWQKHGPVLGCVKYIRQNQGDRKVTDLLHASMYDGGYISGFGYGNTARRPLANTTRLSLNVCRNMIGAVTSKIAAKNKPKPTFLTEDGDYELRERAQSLEKFVGGVFYESGVYAELTRCFRDACVFGTGVLKVIAGSDCVEVERVLPLEIVVDDGEGGYGRPRNIAQRKYYDRLVLLAKAKNWLKDDPEQLDIAEMVLSRRAAIDPEDAEFAYLTTADQVLVTEAWHLGEKDGAAGRHVICIDGCTLVDEEWEGPFPFVFLRWSEPLAGFFGVGLVEELMGIQREINKLLQQIQRGHHLIAGHWMVEHGAKVVSGHLNNDLASIVRWSGSKPDYQTPAIIAPEVYAHLWQLYAKAFEISGISQLNASGVKPAGLDSGEAQRVYQDIQTERFLEVGQAYEEFVVETARQVVRAARRIGDGYKVFAQGKGGGSFVEWKHVDIKDELYRIRVYPTSMLPTTPAGKLAWAQDMIKGEIMPHEDVLDVLDYPDIDAYKARKLGPRKIIERNVAHILKTGEFVGPEPFDNHKLALQLVNEAYANARLDKVPEAKLEMLRRYMVDTVDFEPSLDPNGIISGNGPPPMPGPMPPPMPGAVDPALMPLPSPPMPMAA